MTTKYPGILVFLAFLVFISLSITGNETEIYGLRNSAGAHTVCPRSLDPLHIVTHNKSESDFFDIQFMFYLSMGREAFCYDHWIRTSLKSTDKYLNYEKFYFWSSAFDLTLSLFSESMPPYV